MSGDIDETETQIKFRRICCEDDGGSLPVLDWLDWGLGGGCGCVLQPLCLPLARSALPHPARGKRTWAMPRARLVNLGPSRWCWPICPNTSPAQAFCTGRRRRKVALVCNGGGGEVMHSLAVTSLPPFFSPFPWRRENQESPGHHHHHGHDGSPISSKVGCLIEILFSGGVACCAV